MLHVHSYWCTWIYLWQCFQGDPSAAPYAVDNAKAILGKKPVFGICMGHQVLGQAFGGKTFKLLFGHHGGNHPIRDVATGKVQISAQNHNFAVDPDTLPEGVTVSHINLNDGVHLLHSVKNFCVVFVCSYSCDQSTTRMQQKIRVQAHVRACATPR